MATRNVCEYVCVCVYLYFKTFAPLKNSLMEKTNRNILKSRKKFGI